MLSVVKHGFNYVRFDIFWETRVQLTSKIAIRNRLSKPIIHLYATCWNEARIVPYFMDHYSKFVDEFHIYDNMSSDSTVERLARHKNVTITPFDTGGTFDEATLLQIRNNEWKKSRGFADFVIVCDMDEFLFHPEMTSLLRLLKKHAFTVVKPHGYNMVSENLPEFDGVRAITQLIRTGVPDEKNYSKTIFFNPMLKDINFGPGCHKSHPQGTIKQYHSSRLKLLHYKLVDRETIARKTEGCRERMSENNKRHGWSRHYMKPEDQAIREFDHMLSLGRKII